VTELRLINTLSVVDVGEKFCFSNKQDVRETLMSVYSTSKTEVVFIRTIIKL